MQEIGAGIAADTTLVTSASTLYKIIGTTMNMRQDTKNNIAIKEMIAAMNDIMSVETTTEVMVTMVMIIEAMSTAAININY
jgi:hypothetical protein